MKAVFVESSNGYIAQGPEDNMLWTPQTDKKIFRLISSLYGGVCICSRRTYDLLPKKMLYDENRKFIVAEKTGCKSLRQLNKSYPNAILIGGPTFLKAAYEENVIDTFIVTTLKFKSIKNNDLYENPFIDELVRLDTKAEVDFGELVVRIYYNERKY